MYHCMPEVIKQRKAGFKDTGVEFPYDLAKICNDTSCLGAAFYGVLLLHWVVCYMGSGAILRATITVLMLTGRGVNNVISFVVFSVLDVLDVILCVVYKAVDFVVEGEWKPCYCSSLKEAIMSSNGKIFISENGKYSKAVRICSRKLQLEEVSGTLIRRPSSLARDTVRSAVIGPCEKLIGKGGVGSTVTINSAMIERGSKQESDPIARWSDCDCESCTCWASPSCKERLFVRSIGPKGDKAKEDVLFIHGFISSSAFWSETLFPNFSEAAKSQYRLIAVDLLGFGRSPKPAGSLYTLSEHIDWIQRSVIDAYNVKSFHIVAHSLGCILALAIAVKHPDAVKSLTLLAPPYFTVPKGEIGSQFLMRRVAPRRVWPLITFGASITCWYEHISRTVCFLICRNHRLWDCIIKLITGNRVRTFLVDVFFCHTHNAAWHTLHNVIFGSAEKMDGYLEAVRDKLTCQVNVFHGRDDELLPVECSYAVKSKVPRARVKVIEKKDHITLVVGRQKAFATELEEIWRKSSR